MEFWIFFNRSRTVLDPFGGSGTTGLVANNLGRNAVLIELNKDYVDIAKKRIKSTLSKPTNAKNALSN